MSFSRVLGQPFAVSALEQALAHGREHHAYVFQGPDGVGKELTAFAFARALLCPSGGCDACDTCVRVDTLSENKPHTPLHPDLLIVERGLYPREVLSRSRPELTEISVDQIRTIVLAHANYPPHEGRARVVIIRRAEELSIGAANALLKTLEEPRPGTHFVLLTSRPSRLLSTIRSRTLPLRFVPLRENVLSDILKTKNIEADKTMLALSGGSVSACLALSDPERAQARKAFVDAVGRAVTARDFGEAVALSESVGKNREDLKVELQALAITFAEKSRLEATDNPTGALTFAGHYESVVRALSRLDRNAAPNLTVFSMISEMCHA